MRAARTLDGPEIVANPLPEGGGTDLEFMTQELSRYGAADGTFVEEAATRHLVVLGFVHLARDGAPPRRQVPHARVVRRP